MRTRHSKRLGLARRQQRQGGSQLPLRATPVDFERTVERTGAQVKAYRARLTRDQMAFAKVAEGVEPIFGGLLPQCHKTVLARRLGP